MSRFESTLEPDLKNFGDAGFTFAEERLPAAVCDALLGSLPDSRESAGVRNVIEAPAVRALLASPVVARLVGSLMGGAICAVKATLFDKSADANWGVAWHQDRMIALAERVDDPGFRLWRIKDGVLHADPPAAVLEKMFALRVHLDDCGEADGPLTVIPGTHRVGKLEPDDLRAAVEEMPSQVICASRGDIVAMRPLLLHQSPKAVGGNRRRILHIELAPFDAPSPARWAAAVPV